MGKPQSTSYYTRLQADALEVTAELSDAPKL